MQCIFMLLISTCNCFSTHSNYVLVYDSCHARGVSCNRDCTLINASTTMPLLQIRCTHVHCFVYTAALLQSCPRRRRRRCQHSSHRCVRRSLPLLPLLRVREGWDGRGTTRGRRSRRTVSRPGGCSNSSSNQCGSSAAARIRRRHYRCRYPTVCQGPTAAKGHNSAATRRTHRRWRRRCCCRNR